MRVDTKSVFGAQTGPDLTFFNSNKAPFPSFSTALCQDAGSSVSAKLQLIKFKVVNKAVKAINLSLAKTHPDKHQCVLHNVLGEKDKQVFQNWKQRQKTSKDQRGFHFFSCCDHFLVYCQLRSTVLKYSVNSLSDPAVWAPASVFHPHSWRNNPRAWSD